MECLKIKINKFDSDTLNRVKNIIKAINDEIIETKKYEFLCIF